MLSLAEVCSLLEKFCPRLETPNRDIPVNSIVEKKIGGVRFFGHPTRLVPGEYNLPMQCRFATRRPKKRTPPIFFRILKLTIIHFRGIICVGQLFTGAAGTSPFLAKEVMPPPMVRTELFQNSTKMILKYQA